MKNVLIFAAVCGLVGCATPSEQGRNNGVVYDVGVDADGRPRVSLSKPGSRGAIRVTPYGVNVRGMLPGF